ncbi:MAG: deaminase [Lutisporaceae bacterium]
MIDKDDVMRFMLEAIKASYKSTCFKREIGAVIVKNNEVIASGSSGGNSSYTHCKGINSKSIGKCHWKTLAAEEAKKLGIKNTDPMFEVIKKEFHIYCLSSCAERAAITNAVNAGHYDLYGAVLYCTTYPCPRCAKAIRDHFIKKVYFINEYYPDTTLCQDTERIFLEAGIEQIQVTVEGELGLRGTRTSYEYIPD